MMKLVCNICGTPVTRADSYYVHTASPPEKFQIPDAPDYYDHRAEAVAEVVRK